MNADFYAGLEFWLANFVLFFMVSLNQHPSPFADSTNSHGCAFFSTAFQATAHNGF